ncbi:MAG: hypothetical protein JW928_05495 [Candidatus Aureabacteria bacterium]|nr:hypothetical protein [Candidatus Auribacterota bacterium]
MSVAVVEFQVKGDLGIEDAGAIIAEWMISALAKTGVYELKERVLIAKVLEEQVFEESGLVDEKTIAAKAGKIYGVEAIVTGSVLKWGDTTSVTVRLINSKTGDIIEAADVKTKDENEIPDKIEELAGLISGTKIDPVVGRWKWFNNPEIVFKSNGTVCLKDGTVAAEWARSENKVTIWWKRGWIDKLTLSEDGMHLSGRNQWGSRVTGTKKTDTSIKENDSKKLQPF